MNNMEARAMKGVLLPSLTAAIIGRRVMTYRKPLKNSRGIITVNGGIFKPSEEPL